MCGKSNFEYIYHLQIPVQGAKVYTRLNIISVLVVSKYKAQSAKSK